MYKLVRDGAGPMQLAGDFKCEAAAVALIGDDTVLAAQDSRVVR